MGQIVPDRYRPTSSPGELERGVLFVQKIARPKDATPADYERWLDDPVRLPVSQTLRCSFKDCVAATGYTGYDWYLRSYCAWYRGNTIDFQRTRVLYDGWIYLRAWEQYYAFCPEHQSIWREMTLTESMQWILRLDGAGWLNGQARNRCMVRTLLMYARRRDVLERRTSV